jgi:hypothetical protein
MSKNKTLLVNNDYYFLKSIQINKPSKKDWRHQRNLKKKTGCLRGFPNLKGWIVMTFPQKILFIQRLPDHGMHHEKKGSGHVTNFLVSPSPKQYRLSFYKNSELFLSSSNKLRSTPAQGDENAEEKLEIFASVEQNLELEPETIIKLKGIKRSLLAKSSQKPPTIGLKDFLFAEILNKNLSIIQHSIRTNLTFDMDIVAIRKRIISQVRLSTARRTNG